MVAIEKTYLQVNGRTQFGDDGRHKRRSIPHFKRMKLWIRWCGNAKTALCGFCKSFEMYRDKQISCLKKLSFNLAMMWQMDVVVRSTYVAHCQYAALAIINKRKKRFMNFAI